MAKLQGKSTLITGAAAGLGKGIAEVYVDATAQALRDTYGAEVITAIVDVSQRTDMQAAVARTLAQFGRLDIVCCNAGVARLAPFEAMSDELLDLHINVNIRGVWNTCQAAIAPMLSQGGGVIVIASSVTGDIVADAGEAAYALSKSALVGLTKALAVEYAGTPMVEKMAMESNPSDPESAIRAIASGVPMGRLADPREVGELFAFLGSDESSYLTESQIVIDGGSTLPETVSMGTN